MITLGNGTSWGNFLPFVLCAGIRHNWASRSISLPQMRSVSCTRWPQAIMIRRTTSTPSEKPALPSWQASQTMRTSSASRLRSRTPIAPWSLATSEAGLCFTPQFTRTLTV
ncbi:hypothetical protein D3C81_1691130 [compost metagenome]